MRLMMMTEMPATTTVTTKNEAIEAALKIDNDKSLDRDLETATKALFERTEKKAEDKAEAEKIQAALTEADKIRNLGFVTAADFNSMMKAKEEQLTKAFEEIQQLKGMMKGIQSPAQNSGVLDSPKAKPKNPLLLW